MEPPAAPCSEGAGLNRAGLVRGARPPLSLKPEAGAQAGYLFRSRIIPAYFGANWRQLAAGFSARILQNFCNLQQLVRFARDALVNVFGLTAPLSMPASANFSIFAAFFLTNRYISRAEGTATIEQLPTGAAGCRRTMHDLIVFELAS